MPRTNCILLLQRLEADTVVAVVVFNFDVAIATVVEPTVACAVTVVVNIDDDIATVVEPTVNCRYCCCCC